LILEYVKVVNRWYCWCGRRDSNSQHSDSKS